MYISPVKFLLLCHVITDSTQSGRGHTERVLRRVQNFSQSKSKNAMVATQLKTGTKVKIQQWNTHNTFSDL